MNDTDLDLQLRAALRGPARAPDEAFVAQVNEAVALEERIAAHRRRLWRRFAAEASGSVAVALAFLLMARISPSGRDVDLAAFAPGLAAGLLLVFWLAFGLRPSGAERG